MNCYSLFAFLALSFISFCLCQQCPANYLRYSKEHSYCKPKNPSCAIFHSGVTDRERNQILNLHNYDRSFVATGKEKHAGGMPPAADMLQMVWDWELAAVAQRRAENCIYAHDCFDCRRVENFDVGQNIAYRDFTCPGSCPVQLVSVPDWAFVIKMFYDEVSIFDTKYINSVQFFPEKEYGHFTQMVWAKTWRIGCGYVAFPKENGYRQFYVCNYGPSGNIINSPVYKPGKPCSACPINSCCGTSCGGSSFEGLCRMNNNNEAPIYRQEESYIFYCDFKDKRGDCSSYASGVNKWRYVKALGGSFAEVVLKAGESSTLTFKKTIRPKQSFCLIVTYRTGPAVDGETASNTAAVTFAMPNIPPTIMNLPNVLNKQFFRYSISAGWSYDTTVSFTFSVPRGVVDQFFNIQTVAAKVGRC